MATPYKTLPFTIENGALESSPILLGTETNAAFTIARIDIDGALTAQTAWLSDASVESDDYKNVYDENGVLLSFVIGGNRGHRMRMTDWAIVLPCMKIKLTGAASGAVSGKIYYRVVE